MDVKTNLQVILLVIAFFECDSAALLRTPKVYNALITTDQNLTPSRAYPVIQPAIHDPFFYGPYGYTPYPGYYDPFGFNPFESAAYVPKYNVDGTINVNAANDESVQKSASAGKDETAIIQTTSTEKSRIPLNEFGFPPSLIQLSPGKDPVNLSPYAYNSYPLIYDQFTNYPQSSYLPHFGVLPQTSYGPFAGITPTDINGHFGNGIKTSNGNNFVGTSPNKADEVAVTSTPAAEIGSNSGLVPVTPIAPDGTGLNGSTTPQSSFDTADDALNPIYFDRENGVRQGGITSAVIYGDNGALNNGVNNGIGNGRINDPNDGYDGSGIDDSNNNGFRTAASNNAAVNSNRSTNRNAVDGSRSRILVKNNSAYAQNSGAGIRSLSSSKNSNTASVVGSNSTTIGDGNSNNNAGTSKTKNGDAGFRNFSSFRSHDQSTFSSSNEPQDSFLSGAQNIPKN